MGVKPYEFNSQEIKDKTDIDFNTSLMIEGYALALNDIMKAFTNDSPSGKSYDPMVIYGTVAFSYAFDLKDGGRRHDLNLYADVGELLNDMLKEAIDWVEDF